MENHVLWKEKTMSNKVLIASDSTCDLSPELIDEYNVKILPLYITFGEESYKDNVEIKLEGLYKKVEELNELPKTAAIPPKDFQHFFKEYVNQGYDIVFITIGSELSATYQNAMIAAEEYENRVFCVDSKNLSTGIGLLVLKACKFRDEGLDALTIMKKVSDIVPRVKVQFVVETLEYLHKGGRCSGTIRFLSSLLSIKPMIVVREGKMSVGKKFIGSMKKAIGGMIKLFRSDLEHLDNEFVFITHTLAFDKVGLIKGLIEDVKIEHVYDTVAGCVIGSHCGKGTIGILYILKDQNVTKENIDE